MVDSKVKQALTTSATEYWQLEGMHSDPFGDECVDGWYFVGADREQQLQSALRITRFATQVMVFAGTQGVGKSTLLHALAARLEGVNVVLRLQCSFVLSVEQLFEQIGDQLGLRGGGLSPSELRAQTLQQLKTGLPYSRAFIVLVDDAHELPERTLDSLLELAQDDNNSIKLLLFAATDANGDLRPELASDVVQRVDIAPLDLGGVEDYLRYRLTMAGYDGLFPFTQADLLSLFQHSGGIPEHMHAMAEQKVRAAVKNQPQSLPPTPPTPPTPPRVRIPWLHVAASVALLLFIVALWRAGDDDTASVQRRIQIPPADSVATLPEPRRRIVPAPDRLTRPPAAQRAEDDADANAAAAAVQLPPPEEVAAVELEPEVEKPPVSEPPHAESAAKPAETTAEPIEPAGDSPVAVPANSASADTNSYTGDERYLLSLPAGHYTLQLLGSKSEQGVDDFAKRNRASNIITFRQLLNNKPWYVAVVGDYPNQEQATTALARLPKALRELKPWARPLSKVQGDIRAAAAAR